MAQAINYFDQAMQGANSVQQMQMQQWQFAQAKQQAAQQQAAMQAAGNALPQLLASGQAAQQPQGQMPPPPQPPQPGQPSQGMQPPGQMQPPPQAQGAVKPPLPPFRPMPTTPTQAQVAPQGVIPSPPPPPQAPPPQQAQQGQGGPLTLQSAIKVLQDQGLKGADLMAGLQQLTPLLDSQSKAQAAQAQQQFNQQLQLAKLDETKQALQARIDAAKQASEDRQLGIQERAQAHQDSLAMQGQLLQFRMDEAKQKHAADPDAELDPETVKLLAQQAMTGDTSVYQNLGRGVQGAQNIVAIRKEVARMAAEQGKSGADIAANNVQFGGEKAAARSTAVSSGKQSQAADEANTLADQAIDLSTKVDNSQYPTVNAWVNHLKQQGVSDKQARDTLAAFNVANQGFRNTYARAISPQGTPTVHDKQHTDELFDTNQAPDAYAASLAQAKKEMGAAISAPGHVQAAQRARITGRAPSGSGPTRISTDADYSALPSGAQFIAPDGTTRRKP
jgi:hypothetical protein